MIKYEVGQLRWPEGVLLSFLQRFEEQCRKRMALTWGPANGEIAAVLVRFADGGGEFCSCMKTSRFRSLGHIFQETDGISLNQTRLYIVRA